MDLYGLSRVMLKNIIVGIITLLCCQLLAVTVYFRFELQAEREKNRQIENEYRSCMEEAQKKLERVESEYMRGMAVLQERILEFDRKQRRR